MHKIPCIMQLRAEAIKIGSALQQLFTYFMSDFCTKLETVSIALKYNLYTFSFSCEWQNEYLTSS